MNSDFHYILNNKKINLLLNELILKYQKKRY